MAIKTYRKGANVERKCMAILEKAGYLCIRSTHSGGPVDVVAVGPAGVRLIQVKSETDERTLRPSEIEAALEPLASLRRPPNVTCELWLWRKGRGFIRQETVAWRGV